MGKLLFLLLATSTLSSSGAEPKPFREKAAAEDQKREDKASPKPKDPDEDPRRLERRLQQKSGDGKKGISPDMSCFLDSVQKDGAELSPGTMEQVQQAVKQAEAQGLDSKLDPDIRKAVLEHRQSSETEKP